MKQVHGIWLPDNDTHFEAHLAAGPKFNGAGTYQMKKIELALDIARKQKRDGIALDIGAHVGLWSRVLCTEFAEVKAFEPIKEFAECFRENVKCWNVTLNEVAVGKQVDMIDMTIDFENSGNTRVSNDFVSGRRAVNCISLDSCTFEAPVDFIKIDVEGWEVNVVRGGERTILRDKPIMVVEQKPHHAERYGFQQREAVDILCSWGATIAWERAGDICLRW